MGEQHSDRCVSITAASSLPGDYVSNTVIRSITNDAQNNEILNGAKEDSSMISFNKSTTVLRYFLASTVFSMLLLNSTGAVADAEIVRTGVVQIKDGPIRGYKSDGVDIFLGIPYAAPPIGPLRWMPPQAVDPWHKVLDALAFGNTCVQTNTLGTFAAPSNHEDCLYLNVFAPALGDDDNEGHHEGSVKRPVMVWIHGGGNFDGESNDYDARKLARDGGVVVATLNYRLNVFGFLAHPALDSEGHAVANYGLMDQQFALRWVQGNIATFGGDPRNVTIFGESAGGFDVLANMVSPTAKGLFHRGIVESGAYSLTQGTLTQAEAAGTAAPLDAPIKLPLACGRCPFRTSFAMD